MDTYNEYSLCTQGRSAHRLLIVMPYKAVVPKWKSTIRSSGAGTAPYTLPSEQLSRSASSSLEDAALGCAACAPHIVTP
jgi:hypothetical protein